MVFKGTFFGALICLLATVAFAQTNATPDTKTVVDRMLQTLQENKAKVRPFTVKRGYLLLDKQDQPKAQVVANITVLPPDSKQYNIESSSGGMGERSYETSSAKKLNRPGTLNGKSFRWKTMTSSCSEKKPWMASAVSS